MKNITLSADESLIEAARERARAEQTTLNEQVRRWLAAYAQTQGRMDRYNAVMRGSSSTTSTPPAVAVRICNTANTAAA
jgi:hypothetical protein